MEKEIKIRNVKSGDFGKGRLKCTFVKDKLDCSMFSEENDKRQINKSKVNSVRIDSNNVFWGVGKDILSGKPSISTSDKLKCNVQERKDIHERYLNCEDD